MHPTVKAARVAGCVISDQRGGRLLQHHLRAWQTWSATARLACLLCPGVGCRPTEGISALITILQWTARQSGSATQPCSSLAVAHLLEPAIPRSVPRERSHVPDLR